MLVNRRKKAIFSKLRAGTFMIHLFKKKKISPTNISDFMYKYDLERYLSEAEVFGVKIPQNP